MPAGCAVGWGVVWAAAAAALHCLPFARGPAAVAGLQESQPITLNHRTRSAEKDRPGLLLLLLPRSIPRPHQTHRPLDIVAPCVIRHTASTPPAGRPARPIPLAAQLPARHDALSGAAARGWGQTSAEQQQRAGRAGSPGWRTRGAGATRRGARRSGRSCPRWGGGRRAAAAPCSRCPPSCPAARRSWPQQQLLAGAPATPDCAALAPPPPPQRHQSPPPAPPQPPPTSPARPPTSPDPSAPLQERPGLAARRAGPGPDQHRPPLRL